MSLNHLFHEAFVANHAESKGDSDFSSNGDDDGTEEDQLGDSLADLPSGPSLNASGAEHIDTLPLAGEMETLHSRPQTLESENSFDGLHQRRGSENLYDMKDGKVDNDYEEFEYEEN